MQSQKKTSACTPPFETYPGGFESGTSGESNQALVKADQGGTVSKGKRSGVKEKKGEKPKRKTPIWAVSKKKK